MLSELLRRRTVVSLLALLALLAACTQPAGSPTTTTTETSPSSPAASTPAAESSAPTAAATAAAPETPTPTTIEPEEPCIPSGNQTGIQAALSGIGARAILCPNAVFELTETVSYTDDDQAIYTQGFPTDDSRALLRVASAAIDTAVHAEAHSGVKLSHVIIDGNRPELGAGRAGLIQFGGAASGQVVEWVKAYEPRGWSVLVLNEGDDHLCTNATARYNELGPAGSAIYGMADGISLACRDSTVTDNVITDVTDGGIIIFQAPGTLVANNTIRAVSRVMFYGIGMEDYGPFEGDFTGTVVTGNTIDARSALIRRGIAMGPNLGCIPEEEMVLTSRGATVTDNRLIGDNMGYGFIVAGVEDWIVTGNVDDSTHLVPWKEQDCFGETADAPGGFQYKAALSSGTFQDEYEDAVMAFTVNWWSTAATFPEACLAELIGEDMLADIRDGERGHVWQALEAAPGYEGVESCLVERPMPSTPLTGAEVVVWPQDAGQRSVEMVVFNFGESGTADLSQAEFFVEGIPVACDGLAASLGPDETTSCVISDYVTEGWQVIWWLGIPSLESSYGFSYPFGD